MRILPNFTPFYFECRRPVFSLGAFIHQIASMVMSRQKGKSIFSFRLDL
jgi:hypothetical protein